MRHSAGRSGAGRSGAGAGTTQTWVTLLRACVAFALGVSMLLAGNTKPVLANFIAIYWLLGSVLTLRWVLANRGSLDTRAALVGALVGIVAGVVVLLRFLLTDIVSVDTVLDLVGVAAILTGVLRLSGAFHDDPVAGPRSRAVLGILEVALGAVLVLSTGSTRPTAIPLGLWGLVAGAILLHDALALRRMTGTSG